MRVRVEGLRELDQALGELPRSTGKNVLRRVGRSRLEPLADRATALAPVEAGDLKESIAVSTKKPRRHRRESTVEVYMGPGRHPQGHLQEFGTSRHAPQPFMRPAWDAGKHQLLDGIAEDLGEEIEKAAARAARKAARRA